MSSGLTRPLGMILGACLVLSTPAETGCSPDSCAPVGCPQGTQMRIDLTVSAGTLANQTATVCRNSECYSVALPAVTHLGESDFTFPETGVVWGELVASADPTTTLYFMWTVLGPQPQSGDRYVVTLTDAAGNSTTLLDTTATYEKVYPKDDCGTFCWQGTLSP